MGREQRQFIRLDMRLTVAYKILGTTKLGKTLTEDIGAGGVRFLAEHTLEPGTRLEIVLHLPKPDLPIEFTGEVVWSKPVESGGAAVSGMTEVGLRFLNIEEKDRRLILQYGTMYGPPASS